MVNLECKKRGVCEVGVATDAGSLPGAQPATEESQRELILIFLQHSTNDLKTTMRSEGNLKPMMLE